MLTRPEPPGRWLILADDLTGGPDGAVHVERIPPAASRRPWPPAPTCWSRPQPRLGVCGINPHAGENGPFGHGEEEQKIVPVVQACHARGWAVDGPVKVMGLEVGVNITVGLPVVRTSVDHGTAFDIAGQGVADGGSLVEALRQAAELALCRR